MNLSKNYTITLVQFEEDTTYNYTVTASNCFGNTSTDAMSFRTLPAGRLLNNEGS